MKHPKSILPLWMGSVLLVAALAVGGNLLMTWKESTEEIQRVCTPSSDFQSPVSRSPLSVNTSQESAANLHEEISDRVIEPVAATSSMIAAKNMAPNFNKNATSYSMIVAAHENTGQPLSVLIRPAAPPVNLGGMNLGAPSLSGNPTSSDTIAPAHENWVQQPSASGSRAVGSLNSGGMNSGSTPMTTASSGQSPSRAFPEVKIPAIFANPEAVAALPDNEQANVAQIASDFTSTVENSGVSPNDPQYQKIWNTAAFQADQQYEAQYGIDAFNKMQESQSY